MRARYRVRQFVRTILAPGAPPDLGALDDLLTPQQQAFYSAMAGVDQRHCLAVAQALAADGWSDPDLLRAALVHDAGKAATHISIWERVAHVLIARCAPRLAGRLGSPHAGGLAHGLYVLAHHAELGADMAQRAGFPAATVALLRGAGDAQQQHALHQADDRL